jgi:hypothetical protein
MFNVNGPPKGFNVLQDQSSYDLVYKDIIVDSNLGTIVSPTNYSYNLGVDSINLIYKAELVAAAVQFNTAIPNTIKNKTVILSIPQLNNKTTTVAGNTSGSGTQTNQVYNPGTGEYDPVVVTNNIPGQGNNIVQGDIFCQIPDNNTPLTNASITSNNVISLLIGPHMYDSLQFYNPPINRLNFINVQWFDTGANSIPVTNATSGTIKSFYFTLRIHYFIKRCSTSSFSTSVITNAGTGTMDSMFQPNSINR